MAQFQSLQKWSDRWCLHWVERLRPFYEAFTGPCHDNYCFWPGLLYILRSALFALNMYLDNYEKHYRYFKIIAVSSVCILIMSLACIFPHGVYKRWPLSLVTLVISIQHLYMTKYKYTIMSVTDKL